MKRIYFGMIPVPWIFAGLFFLNGRAGHFCAPFAFPPPSPEKSPRARSRAAAAFIVTLLAIWAAF